MNSYLEHHGVKGQKWGVRRYQNEDGSLTSLGKKRYNEYIKTKDGKKLVNDYLNDDWISDENGNKLSPKEGQKILKDLRRKDKDKYNEFVINQRKLASYLNDYNNQTEESVKEAAKALRLSPAEFEKRRYQDFVMADDRVSSILVDHGNEMAARGSSKKGRSSNAFDETGKMSIRKEDTSVTKKVKEDFNNMSDKEFKASYHVDKKTYQKRVEKWGDPYRYRTQHKKTTYE